MNCAAMRHKMLAAGLAAATAMFLSGCGEGDAGYGSHAGHDHGEHSTTEGSGDASKIAKAMAELGEEDRALAEKQKTCPIGEGPLGDMGKPYKLVLNGETVFLCCDGCKEKAEADPDATVAKVQELVAANSGEGGE